MKKGLIAKVAALALMAGIVTFSYISPVLASSKVESSENGVVSVATGEVVDGAAFLAGRTVTIEGKVNGDVYCAAETVRIYGKVNGDVMCAGSTLDIKGNVNGDVRVAGANVTVGGMVRGSLTVAANTVTIDKDAVVQRDALLAGSSVRLDGTVQRDLRVGSEALELVGLVGRNVDSGVTHLVVSNGSKVGGDVQYWSENVATIYEGTVVGKTTRHEPVSYEAASTVASSILGVAGAVAFLVVLSIGVVLVVPRTVRSATSLSLPKLGFALLIGLGAIFLSLPLMIVLVVTVIGVPIALLVIVGYLVLSTLALPLVAYYIGRWMFEGRSSNMVLHAATGATVLGLIIAIPILGALAGFAAFAAGVGIALYNLRNQFGQNAYKDTQKISELNKSDSTKAGAQELAGSKVSQGSTKK